ncbi:ATP-grasp domain-containing protein, partial [Bradyrhizobium sp.]|uniref:ATP-binding protein n=1 Tax=Bradyrhizobium sp. TaxID=376 RepID=UPI0025C30CA0
MALALLSPISAAPARRRADAENSLREPFVPKLLSRIADRANVCIELEPEFGYAGRIVFADGTSHPFKAGNLNINRGGAMAIADDKSYTSFFLRQAGLRTPRELTFFSEKLRANLDPAKARTAREACHFAERIGYPVIVKPNIGSFGNFVSKAYGPDEVMDAAALIFAKNEVALVQEFLAGNDHRIVVLGDEIVAAYQRVSLRIIGDGRSTVQELLLRKKASLPGLRRPNSDFDPADSRIDRVLARARLARDTVLSQGAVQPLLDNANLSTGGDVIDITDKLDPGLAATAVKATKALGLTLCGVDVICADATRPSDDHVILE